MKKTAVIYATKTRHSKKLAEAIGSFLNIKIVCRGSMFFVSARHPNAKDLSKATDFAQKIVRMSSNS